MEERHRRERKTVHNHKAERVRGVRSYAELRRENGVPCAESPERPRKLQGSRHNREARRQAALLHLGAVPDVHRRSKEKRPDRNGLGVLCILLYRVLHRGAQGRDKRPEMVGYRRERPAYPPEHFPEAQGRRCRGSTEE